MLNLNVQCNDDSTMDVTSHHLDLVPAGARNTWAENADPGDEIAVRSENFGKPVGKGVFVLD